MLSEFPWLQIAPPRSVCWGFVTWQAALRFRVSTAFPLVFAWTELWSGACRLEIRARAEGVRRLSFLHPSDRISLAQLQPAEHTVPTLQPPWRLPCAFPHREASEPSFETVLCQYPSSVHTFVVPYTLFSSPPLAPHPCPATCRRCAGHTPGSSPFYVQHPIQSFQQPWEGKSASAWFTNEETEAQCGHLLV